MLPADTDAATAKDDAQLRFFLGWILAVMSVGIVLLTMVVVLSDSLVLRRLVVLGLVGTVVALAAASLSRNVKLSGGILLLGIWAFTAFNSVAFSGVHSAPNAFFAFSIVMTGWLMRRRALIACTLASMGWLIALALAEHHGLFVPTPRAGAMNVLIVYLVAMPVFAFMTWGMRSILVSRRLQTQRLLEAQQQKAKELEQSEAALQAWMENMPAALVSLDMQLNLVRCNTRYAEMFGSTRQQLTGRNIDSYMSKEVLDQVRGPVEAVLRGQAQTFRRFSVHPVTHAVTWLESRVMPFFVEGVQMGLDGIYVDVTEMVEAEAKIRGLNASLEKRVEARTEELSQARSALQESRDELLRSQAKAGLSAMVASVSHELGTPIGNSVLVASTFADLARKLQFDLAQGSLRKSELKALSDMLIEGGQQLKTNLDRADALLRNFKQVSADQASEQRRSFDLSAVVAEVVGSLAPSLRRTPHRVEIDIAPGLVMDSLPGPVGQVLINLINNSLLHAFDPTVAGVVKIAARPDASRVVITLQDNGNGMTEEVRTRLFEPFFSTKIGKGGTGLGMGIVETIVRKSLGGTMSVKSEIGHGTLVEIDLPVIAPLNNL